MLKASFNIYLVKKLFYSSTDLSHLETPDKPHYMFQLQFPHLTNGNNAAVTISRKILAKQIIYLKIFKKKLKHVFTEFKVGHFLLYKLNLLNNIIIRWYTVFFNLTYSNKQKFFNLMLKIIRKNLNFMISTTHLMIKITKQLLQEVLKIFLFIYNSDFTSAIVSLWVLIPAVISRGKTTFCQWGQLA